jgi:hypothetical protein
MIGVHPISMERPSGVTAIVFLFFTVSAYLMVLGVAMLVSPGSVGMRLGAPLLGGLELAGPYMFLLAGAIAALIGFGLMRLSNWARRAAALVAIAGVVMLVPSVSAAVVTFHGSALVWGGLGVILRVAVAWYLYQQPTVEAFERTVS